MNTKVTMIPVAQLHPHPDNPRKDLGDITELTASIKANGVYLLPDAASSPENAGSRPK